ncbi:MAG: OmpH family outer membrane protein [Phycisphaerales bacterium]|nr:OmpH family outer membrane protein [Phycisphaerales bacterium]MCI0674377.1 OmpH family outer membrane protein [Phycisphaerales bacterium]
MTSSNKYVSVTTGLLLTIIVALVAFQTFANRPLASGPTEAAVIATFDLEKTFNSLDEKKAKDAERAKLAENLNSQCKKDGEALRELESELKDHLKGSDKYRQLEDKLQLDSLDYRAYVEFCTTKIDVDRARTMKDLFMKIRETVAQIARESHYAIVFVSEPAVDIKPGTEEETRRQISVYRTAYTDPQIDITENLISRLNKAFQDAGGVVPPPAPPAPVGPAPAPK